MSRMDVHFSSDSDLWETPQWLFDELNKEFHFVRDVAASAENSKCESFYDEEDSALNKSSWLLFGTDRCSVWCNPPYSRGKQKQFIAKAAKEMGHGVTTVMLIPARTDTKAWHDYIWDEDNHHPREGVEVRLLRGRLKFEKNGKPILDKHGRPQSAPFPRL